MKLIYVCGGQDPPDIKSVIMLRMCKLLRFLSNMEVSAVRKSSRERKPVLRLIDEVSSSRKLLQNDLDLLAIEADEAKSRKRRYNKFYEVEIAEVDKENRKMKLHFKGYSHRYDEWRDYPDVADPEVNSMNFSVSKFVKLEKPSEESFGERSRKLQSTLSLEIKRRLLSVRRDDPDVRLELPIDEDIFYKVFGSLGRLSKSRGRTVHRIIENSQLDSILETLWSVRIKNEMGTLKQLEMDLLNTIVMNDHQ